MPSSLGTVFVDTSAFKAFYDERDDLHAGARDFMSHVASRKLLVKNFITTDYVLDESITLIRFAHTHSKAVEFAQAITASRATKILYVGEESFDGSLGLFNESTDKEWSFTDCVSFSLMRSLGVARAFSFDPHFSQAGFQTLPK